MLILDTTPSGVRLYCSNPADRTNSDESAAMVNGEMVFTSLPAGHTIFGYVLPNGADMFPRPVEEIRAPALERLAAAARLAPDENAAAARLAREGLKRYPGGRHFILCESALFSSFPERARYYALPQPQRGRHPRSGHDGLVHAWVWKTVGKPYRMVSIRLGETPNIASILEGAAVESSAAPGALEGLPSLTGCGGIDPTIVLDLLREGCTPDEVRTLLQKNSGLQLFANKPAPLAEITDANEFPRQMLLRGILKETGAALAALDGADLITISAGNPGVWRKVIAELEQRLAFLNIETRVLEAPRGKVLVDTLNASIG